ncbi:hypothetical protein HBI56_211910 [Parastagonospora nodorum]|nr:hypothetical protein HBH56_212460 [Parastagonospora nodorum]KAH3922997.1 hypothetical protein HBH54_214130 [Parastagonospora nodorum]KAH4018333.1 hypothetical protein HBI09_192980 [Parastagonospora nodorum]KAH4128384.1 hypothetical protein HBH45_209590 [Parastagonospora nodorum]KAH4149072.1 hypothetical protein HBH44_198680 [Parastagonospora nodorum]
MAFQRLKNGQPSVKLIITKATGCDFSDISGHALLPEPSRHRHCNSDGWHGMRLRRRVANYAFWSDAVLYGEGTRDSRHQHLEAKRQYLVQSCKHNPSFDSRYMH